MKNLFQDIKEKVSMQQVAEHYGLRINRANMACCPFHPDRHPSMLVDQNHYYCFGCHAHGDAIDYVARLFHLSQIQAAEKLVRDFDLPVKDRETASEKAHRLCRGRIRRRNQRRAEASGREYAGWRLQTLDQLGRCEKVLEKMQADGAPSEGGEEFPKSYEKASTLLQKISYRMDILCFGSESDRLDLFLRRRKEVDDVVSAVRDLSGSEG